MRACNTPLSVSSSKPSLSASSLPAGYTSGIEMKSASVRRPCSGRNLQTTPNGLLKAINTRAASQARHCSIKSGGTVVAGTAEAARRRRCRPPSRGPSSGGSNQTRTS